MIIKECVCELKLKQVLLSRNFKRFCLTYAQIGHTCIHTHMFTHTHTQTHIIIILHSYIKYYGIFWGKQTTVSWFNLFLPKIRTLNILFKENFSIIITCINSLSADLITLFCVHS